MKIFRRKGKSNKTWRHRAWVVDLSKTRVVFETTKRQEKEAIEEPPTPSSQCDYVIRQYNSSVITRAYTTHIFDRVGWSR